MSGQRVGYIRVSSSDQSTERQLSGLSLDRVFEDQCSGKSTDRPALTECLAYLRKGDTLIVHSIDRLARNLLDLQQLIVQVTKAGTSVEFITERLTFSGDDNPFQTLQLQIIGACAEFERNMIRERQREGIAAAKAAGKHLGRPSTVTEEHRDAIRLWLVAAPAERSSKNELIASLGLAKATGYRAIDAVTRETQSMTIEGNG